VEPSTECSWPNFSLSVKGSYEMFAHIWYCVHVSISFPGSDLEPGKSTSWTVPRRLCHFQDGLLEYVKVLPAAAYNEHFRGVAFRAGPKLNGWCTALSAAVNSGQASPFFVARCLRWTEKPTVAVWDVAGLNREADQDYGVPSEKHEHTAEEKIAPTEHPSHSDKFAEVVESNEKGSEVLEPIEPRRDTEDEAILRAVALAQNKHEAPDIDV